MSGPGEHKTDGTGACLSKHPLTGRVCTLEKGHPGLHGTVDVPRQDPAPAFTLREDMNAAQRKARPLYSGVLAYFPDALLEVAHCSKVGNDQHNPGQPLHWAKEKSQDEPDALVRHLLDTGTADVDGVLHDAKVAWRALANLQRRIDAIRAARKGRQDAAALTVADVFRGGNGDPL